MKKIKIIYDLVRDFLDKNNGKFITAEEFNRLYKVSSTELYDECIGATNKRLDNRSLVGYGRSQNTDKRLEPFRSKVTLAVVNGEATLPPSCGKITSVMTSREELQALTRIDEDRIGMLRNNPLREPNEDDMYYLEEKESLMILGALTSVYVLFLKKPTVGEYKEKDVEITVGNRTVIRRVYDEAGTIDIEWSENELLDIVNRIVQKLSIPTRDQFTNQAVQANKNNE